MNFVDHCTSDSGLTAAQKQNNNSEESSSNQNIRPKKPQLFRKVELKCTFSKRLMT